MREHFAIGLDLAARSLKHVLHAARRVFLQGVETEQMNDIAQLVRLLQPLHQDQTLVKLRLQLVGPIGSLGKLLAREETAYGGLVLASSLKFLAIAQGRVSL